MPATSYAIPINALIKAMLNDDFDEAYHLLNTAPEGKHHLEPFTQNTLDLLAEKDYTLPTEPSNKTPLAIHFLINLANSWYEKHKEPSEEHAQLYLRILDALYPISPVFYFDQLLITARKFTAGKTEPLALNALTKGLHERIRNKMYSIEDLKAFTKTRSPYENNFFRTAGKPGFCVTAEEASLIYKADERRNSADQAKSSAAETRLLPLLALEQTEKTTLFSAILQCHIFNREDANRALNASRLEFFYHLMADKNEPINLMIPASALIDGYRKQITPLQLTKAANDHHPDHEKHLAFRFMILKHLPDNAPIVESLFNTFTEEHELETKQGKTTTYRYPAWLISTALNAFNIDVNESGILAAWFQTKSTPMLAHLLSVEAIQPDDHTTKAIAAYLKKETQQSQTGNLWDRATRLSEARTKANMLAQKLTGDTLRTFKKHMVKIGLFEPKPAPAPTTVHAPHLPEEKPEIIVSRIIRNTKGNALGVREFLVKENLQKFFDMTPTADDLLALKDRLAYTDINRNKFATFKKEIIQFILADEARKEKIRTLLDHHPEDLEAATKQNYLLYLLSLGRTYFKPHTTKTPLFNKHNHFTALNDVLHDILLPEKTLKKFGLFREQPVGEAVRDTKKRTPEENKSKPRRPRKGSTSE